MTPNKEEILKKVGKHNIKTINPIELQETEKDITMVG